MTDAEIVARIMASLYATPEDPEHHELCPSFDRENAPCTCAMLKDLDRTMDAESRKEGE